LLEAERKQRDEYNSMMLWMIAQPTRKHPEKLPRFEDVIKEKPAKRTAQSILNELLTKWG